MFKKLFYTECPKCHHVIARNSNYCNYCGVQRHPDWLVRLCIRTARIVHMPTRKMYYDAK